VRPIVLAAGGTGGHFFPAEALAAALLARGHRIALMTDARSAAATSETFAGAERFVLRGAGLAGRGARAAGAAVALAVGVVQARRILARLDAAAVVGFGGYPSVAPALAAASLRRRRPPIVLHEQNAVLGRANRFLSRHADALALGFSGTLGVPASRATVVVGNPVRPAIAALRGVGYAPPGEAVLHLLVLGGSLGARILSDTVPAAVALLPPAVRARLSIVQQARAEDVARVRNAYVALGVQAEIAPFFADVADRLATAHLVIARAGASTVAELAVIGRPAILVPLPGAIDDHQTANARALGRAGGAWPVPQAQFSPEMLAEQMASLFADRHALPDAAVAAASVGMAEAAALLADLVESRMQTAAMQTGERVR
jgi:UDP-N-acetylglucosamine--N-acetylmuramyl-(pentapeptide) pyrophosphoryl-undecaprenol N-acetylglucosamine transferase